MKDSPLVSIITPVYNAGPYLKETIESVLGQTYKNFELLMVDDGSTDNSKEVILSFTDPRIHYIYQKNSGQSAARNNAIAQAKGKYIALLDADDVFFPKKLEEQVAYMETHPDCDFCYCKIYHFFDRTPRKLYYLEMQQPSGHLFDKLLTSNFINPLSVMVKKEIFETHGAFEPKFRWADEQYLWLKLSFKKITFGYLDKGLGKCRLHTSSFTNRPNYFKESQEQCLEILELFKNQMTEQEKIQYKMEELQKKTIHRIKIGKLMMGKNPFSRFIHALYLLNRKRKLKEVRI